MATWTYVGPKLSTGEPERNLSLAGISSDANGDVDDEGLDKEQIAVLRASEFYKHEGAVQAAKTRAKNATKRTAAKPKPAPVIVSEPEPAPEPPDESQPEPMPADSGEQE